MHYKIYLLKLSINKFRYIVANKFYLSNIILKKLLYLIIYNICLLLFTSIYLIKLNKDNINKKIYIYILSIKLINNYLFINKSK